MIQDILIQSILFLIAFILLVYINSKIIFGFYAATRDGNILEVVQHLCDAYLPNAIKPICNCPVCMSSLHSLWIWLPAYVAIPFTWWLIYLHIAYIFALAGLNKIITSLRGIDL